MKSPLPALIRRADMLIEERRRELAEVQAEEDCATRALRDHDDFLASEQAGLPDRDLEAMAGFVAWKRHHALKREALADRRGKLLRTREAAQAALMEAVAEGKRLELAEEARQADIKRAVEKRAEAKAEEIEVMKAIDKASRGP